MKCSTLSESTRRGHCNKSPQTFQLLRGWYYRGFAGWSIKRISNVPLSLRKHLLISSIHFSAIFKFPDLAIVTSPYQGSHQHQYHYYEIQYHHFLQWVPGGPCNTGAFPPMGKGWTDLIGNSAWGTCKYQLTAQSGSFPMWKQPQVHTYFSHVFTSQLLFQVSKSWTVSLNCWVH